MSRNAAEAPVRFHLSLNASDLARSVAFYRVLFGQEPAKLHDDYAKFDLADPPVVFALVPMTAAAAGSLNRLGLRLADAAALGEVRQRLESAGVTCQCEANTVCVADPDGNLWEICLTPNRLHEPVTACLQRAGAPQASRTDPPPDHAGPNPEGPIVWDHFVTSPLPERIPHDDESVDEVRLVGSFNAALTDAQRLFLLREVWRVLRPGGELLVHALMADRPFPNGPPRLTGLAALVSRVPPHAEPLRELQTAGFAGIHFVKFDETPWIRHDGVELREVKLIGWKPDTVTAPARHVVYKGPFAEVSDGNGLFFPRGQPVPVSAATWDLLRRGAAAECFFYLDPAAPACRRG